MMLAKTNNIWKRNPQKVFFFARKNGITSEEEINKKKFVHFTVIIDSNINICTVTDRKWGG